LIFRSAALAPEARRPRAAGATSSCWKSFMRFLTPKLREVDRESFRKILVKEKSAQEAALLCVHYYALTSLSLG
jgi:hypothetical protein